MERLIVDTGVLIALERGIVLSTAVLPDDADVAIAAVTASELLVGVELAEDTQLARRRETVAVILRTFDVLPFDLDTAHHHAALLAHARRSGRPRGAHDLQIAATARATGRTLLTTEKRGSDDLPGVSHRVV